MARILIIDDEAAIRRSVRKILEIPGHEVDEAVDGFVGLALHSTRPYDIIITDLRMPVFNGIEVIASLRQIDGKVNIILISGEDQSDTRTRTAELGAVWVLSKPFAVQELQALVHTLIGQSS